MFLSMYAYVERGQNQTQAEHLWIRISSISSICVVIFEYAHLFESFSTTVHVRKELRKYWNPLMSTNKLCFMYNNVCFLCFVCLSILTTNQVNNTSLISLIQNYVKLVFHFQYKTNWNFSPLGNDVNVLFFVSYNN